MSDATEAIVDIIEALSEYGSAISLTIVPTGAYNTATGEVSGASGLDCSTTLLCDAVLECSGSATTVVDTEAFIRYYSIKELQGSTVDANDVEFRVYYNGVIGFDDTITYDGKTYELVKIDKINLQDTDILYTIQGRA